ncbi:MAG: glucose-6-phosphate dehydrogenase, partial [Planctomycetota bacterium]
MLLNSKEDPGPAVMTIFGASGDLMRRKVAPAIYNLFREDLLHENMAFIGFARSDYSDESFRERIRSGLSEFARGGPPDEEEWEELAQRIFYEQGDYRTPAAFESLAERVRQIDGEFGIGGGRLHYLAVPPEVVEPIVLNLNSAGLLERRSREEETKHGAARVVLEKPFGRDLESARELNRVLERQLDESQIFRMDHYLGKETVQNILVLRFANAIFEPIWQNRYVKHVHVTVAEKQGIGSRAGYFENAGALRDVMQNHVLQLLALFTMEPPASLEADAIRDEKAKVLRCLRRLSGEELECSVVRGQYGPGTVDGDRAPGYREEKGVSEESCTETFVALRTYIDNWRWAGVPFYLTTGKRLPRKLTEVAIEFKQVPPVLFGTFDQQKPETNVLKIRVQPDENVI